MTLRNRCARCNELLHPDREEWLELDQRVNHYTDQPVPARWSQGGFPFGKACAKKAIAEHKKALETLSYKAANSTDRSAWVHQCGCGNYHCPGDC